MLTGQRTERAAAEKPTPGAVLGLVVSVMAMIVLPFAVTGTNLALPAIKEDFGSSLAALSWTLSGYSIVLAGFTMLGGTVSSRLGFHRTFAIGVGVLTVGSVVCMAAPNTPVLIAGRVVQALGGALAVPSSVSVALCGWPDSRRAFAIGVWTAAFPIGSSVAPTVSALLISAGSWRLIFVVPIVLGTAAFVLVYFLPRPPGGGASAGTQLPDVLGMVLGTAAAGLAALGLVQGHSWGWTSPATVLVLATAFVLMPVFVVRSRRHPRPFLPMPLFAIRTFRVANGANIFVSMIGISVWLLWPLLLGGLWKYDALGIGLAMTPTPMLAGTVAIASTRWAQRHGYRNVLISGAVSLVVANLWFLTHTEVEPNYWGAMFPGLVFMGFGMGLLFAPLNAAALMDLSRADFAAGNATFSTGRFLSGAIGIAAVVAMLGEATAADPTRPFERAYLLLLVMAVLALAVIVVAWPKRSAAAIGASKAA